ncbi:MAG: FAD:protein FMN transferase [Bacilli bacterium]|nr:FAD:protein FMN transferase [Bacilli bacterium]
MASCASAGGTVNPYGFDTLWEATLYQGTHEDTEWVKDFVVNLSESLDPYKTHSKMYRLNSEREVAGGGEFEQVLRFAVEMQNMTGGAFNPFTLGLNDAWKTALGQGEVLSQSEIEPLLETAKSTSLEFSDGKIRLVGEGNIDLGAIAKGFCMDCLKGYLDEKAIDTYIISGGSSSLLIGKSGNGVSEYYNVIPRDYQSEGFKAKECGISTSSISEQLFDIDGVAYSHIVNALTGSAEAQYVMALAKLDFAYMSSTDFPNAMLDAATTAFFAMGEDEIAKFCEEHHMEFMLGGKDGIIKSTIDA